MSSPRLEEIAENIRVAFEAKYRAREKALALSRETIRSSAVAIRAIHRQEFDRAEELLARAAESLAEAVETLRPYPAILYAGFVQDAQKECAEGHITLAFVGGRPLPTPASLRVEEAPYLNGLAVAQAQHVTHELERVLASRGVDVRYAIHPVAGRMPGHMNVLLAEANVDYSKLVEMDDINPEFATMDVALIVGANDVVNPAAKTNSSSPIYGMPILEVEKANQVIVIKRSMGAGYSGVENELFYHPKTSMLFGDARDVITKLIAELKTM